MSKVENIDKFLVDQVKRWKRKDFIQHFESRYSNAEEIYDSICGTKPKKKKESRDSE